MRLRCYPLSISAGIRNHVSLSTFMKANRRLCPSRNPLLRCPETSSLHSTVCVFVDFSALAGPYCTLVLGQYGGPRPFTSSSRPTAATWATWGPPYYGDQASYFMGLNNGKQGISIDLKRPEGIELCLKLIERVERAA